LLDEGTKSVEVDRLAAPDGSLRRAQTRQRVVDARPPRRQVGKLRRDQPIKVEPAIARERRDLGKAEACALEDGDVVEPRDFARAVAPLPRRRLLGTDQSPRLVEP
jgi:hypothetical protein